MNNLRTVIIDDVKKARASLIYLLEKYCKGITIVGVAQDAESGKVLIEREKPDIVFLDIEMPGGSGFDLLKSLDYKGFALIFVTAYNEYAIQAFKSN
ncbi:MAG: response regulator, partial [Flavobacteriales bacterium]|nr:response regulator [Flavobacteriales bacterium]